MAARSASRSRGERPADSTPAAQLARRCRAGAGIQPRPGCWRQEAGRQLSRCPSQPHVLPDEVPVSSSPFLCPLVAAALLAASPPAPAQHSYYLLISGSQPTPPAPEHSHSFATFVRVRCDGPVSPIIETVTISWLPANLCIRLRALLPEPGHNFGLHETIRFALGDGQRVSLWGPYQIDPELYYRASRQQALLESGQVRYKAFDTGYPTDRVSNCIHAIGSIAEGYRVRVASPGWGETASYALLRRLTPWICDPCRTHPWLARALGLDCYPIIYRDFEAPRSGALRGPISRLLGTAPAATPTYGPPR